MVADAASAGSLVEHFKAKISSLEREVQDKAAEVADLNDKLKSKERELTEVEANSFAQIKESARLTKRHEAEIAKLKKEFDAAEPRPQSQVRFS
jgi:septal ring factor EnvC (AmiA/AmiB activator)